MAGYPQHEKLRKVSAKSQAIGTFLDWLALEKGWRLSEYRGRSEHLTPIYYDTQRLLAEFFEIDYDALMAEKDQMLTEMRKLHSA